MRVPIRAKLIVAILMPLLAVYLSVLAINHQTGKRQAIQQAQRHLTELVSHHAARLDGRLVTVQQAAQSLAGLIAEQEPTFVPRRLDAVLGRGLVKNPVLHGTCVALEPGTFGHTDRFARLVYRAQQRKPAKRPPARKKPPTTRPAKPGSRPAPAKRPEAGKRRPTPPRPLTETFRRVDLARADPDFYEEEWYQEAKRRGTAVWGEPGPAQAAGGVTVSRYSVPIFRDEEFLGVVAFDIAVAPFQKYVAQTKLEGGYCVLISRSGLLIAHPRKDQAMRESLYGLADTQERPTLGALADEITDGGSGVWRIGDFHTGQQSWVVFEPIHAAGWSFAAVIPEGQIMAPVYERLRHNMAMLLGGLGVIIALVLLVSISITRPIKRLAPVVRRVANGDLDARVSGVLGRDEIGEFAGAFNTMVGDLKQHVEALTRATAARQAVESELRIAREIQAALLPHAFPPFPQRSEFDLHALHVPAKQVAGDFFDYFFLDDQVLSFLIADVSGKGVPAALFMAVSRTVLRGQAAIGAGPAEILTRANRILAQDNERAMFVTIFFAHYHTKTGLLTYANAGHNPPCICSPGARVQRLTGSRGLILGVFDDVEYHQGEVRMAPGDCLVLYTDGVTEALDARDRQFGLDRLERIAAGNGPRSPEEICHLIVRTVEDHSASAHQDDVTLLVLRRNP